MGRAGCGGQQEASLGRLVSRVGEAGRLPSVPTTPAGPGDVPIPCSLMYRCWRISAWLSWQDVWDENVATLLLSFKLSFLFFFRYLIRGDDEEWSEVLNKAGQNASIVSLKR